MESGSIASWRVSEGDSFSAGDAIAEIQTDKATMAFEAQDAGFVAKLLVKAGDGTDIKIGSPIMVTVEEQEYVQAFTDFVLPIKSENVVTPVEANAPVNVVPDVKPIIPSIPLPPLQVQTETKSDLKLPQSSTATPHVTITAIHSGATVEPTSAASSPITVGPAWGSLSRAMSPLTKILSQEQKSYVERFGSTGQFPL
jgi:pyruvate dehydrogenase E2 component (dihydrolipoamide acetyltransferase)